MRPSRSQPRDSSSDPEDGSCQPTLGRAPYPRGVAQAGYPHFGTNRVATPPQKASTSFSNLKGVPRQPSEPVGFNRFLYAGDRDFSGSVRFGGFGPSSTQGGAFQRGRTSDGGLDHSANPGSAPRRHGAKILDPRSGMDHLQPNPPKPFLHWRQLLDALQRTRQARLRPPGTVPGLLAETGLPHHMPAGRLRLHPTMATGQPQVRDSASFATSS